MNKKEQKILEELRNQVFKKDADIKKRHEAEELNKATKEGLLEMTELSSKEIDDLEKRVRHEFSQRKKRKIRLYSILIFVFILSVSMLYYYTGPYQYEDKLIFHENFENNINEWDIYDNYEYHRYFEDGKYVFITNENDYCSDDALRMKLPKRFTVEITTTWIKGKYNEYGPKFMLTFDGYFSFVSLIPKNKTLVYSNNSNFRYKPKPILLNENPGHASHKYTQKISIKPHRWAGDPWVRGGDINYTVNDQFVKKIKYSDIGTYGIKNDRKFEPKMLISVCGCQTVSFDYIKIRNDITGKIIYDGSFEGLKEYFSPGMKAQKISMIEEGEYIFITDDEGNCHKSVIPYKLKKNTKVSLTSRWLKGENNYYGLVLEQDENNYYAFELKQNGKACFRIHVDGNDETFIDNLETDLTAIKGQSTEQTVFLNGDVIEYYVNDRLILKEYRQLKSINAIGFRVFGSQKVAFGNLKIRE